MTREEFATKLLEALGIPVNSEAVHALVAWQQAEGTRAAFNPLATTQSANGASNFNSVGVKNYTNVDQGIAATAQTLQNGRYGAILAALRSGTAMDVAKAIAASPWGTGTLVIKVLGGTVAPKAPIGSTAGKPPVVPTPTGDTSTVNPSGPLTTKEKALVTGYAANRSKYASDAAYVIAYNSAHGTDWNLTGLGAVKAKATQVTPTGTVVNPTSSATALSPHVDEVRAIYAAFVGRQPSQAEINQWTGSPQQEDSLKGTDESQAYLVGRSGNDLRAIMTTEAGRTNVQG